MNVKPFLDTLLVPSPLAAKAGFVKKLKRKPGQLVKNECKVLRIAQKRVFKDVFYNI